MRDYFVDRPLYPPSDFQNKFRMRKPLFMKIMADVVQHDQYFLQKPDCTGTLGHTPEVKITAALRMLAYGTPAHLNDDYLKIGETTSNEACMSFCHAINKIYEGDYLRRPTNADIFRLLSKATERGFPGMLGSLDCMHWQWKNCPVAHHGTYRGHKGHPTIILEAVASYDTWIWHAYFGMPGAANDLNVLYRSNLFDDVLEGRAPNVNFSVNGRQYSRGYYLTDGIYPKWATLIQAFSQPQNQKQQIFTRAHEAYRKDVERAFGILQAQWAIVAGPTRMWYKEDIASIMKTCIILHNMIVEDERELRGEDPSYHIANDPVVPLRDPATIHEYLLNRSHLVDQTTNINLRNNIVEHYHHLNSNGMV
jgi:hypothetical protein